MGASGTDGFIQIGAAEERCQNTSEEGARSRRCTSFWQNCQWWFEACQSRTCGEFVVVYGKHVYCLCLFVNSFKAQKWWPDYWQLWIIMWICVNAFLFCVWCFRLRYICFLILFGQYENGNHGSMESLGLSNSGAMKVCIGGGAGFNLNRKRKLEEEVMLHFHDSFNFQPCHLECSWYCFFIMNSLDMCKCKFQCNKSFLKLKNR